MKKILGAMAVAVMAASVVFGAGADTTGYDYINLAHPAQYTNGTTYSTGTTTNACDLTAYNGKAKLIVFVSGDEGTAASTNADRIVLQHAAYATGTWSTVSALTSYMPTLGTTSKVATVNIDLETLKNFARIGVTTSSMGETNAAHTVGAVLVAPHKND